MRARAIAALAVCLLLSPIQARANLDQTLDATCRVRSTDGGTGSGCVFAIAEGRVWVLTAAHVVEGGDSGTCEFWRRGHQSRPLPYRVAGRSTSYDVATLVLDVRAFGGVLPEVVPLAPPDAVLRPGETITSAGCANGAWATGFAGHALGYSGTRLQFVPPPANGRSGSAIFDADGRYIVAVVQARAEESSGSYGLAGSIQSVYAAFGSPQQRSSALTALSARPAGELVPIDWTQCPGSTCPGSSDQPRWYLLPYRFRQQFEHAQPSPSPAPSPGGGGAWPTLPPAGGAEQDTPGVVPVVPAAPSVTIDVSPLAEPLQGLADSQRALSDAVAAYLDAEAKRKAAAEAEQRIGAVAPALGEAGSAALHGDYEGAADTLGESGSVWATLAEVLWAVVAPLLGIGAVGYGFGRVIVRSLARALGPAGYDAAKAAIVDWWKDDNDTPDEARAKQRLAEAAADATVRKLNGGAQSK